MKALLSRAPGGPESLTIEVVPDPTVPADGVLIRVMACSVNFPDTLMIVDKYQVKPPRPFSPGGEVAGLVEAVGPKVTRFKVGQRVIANTGFGGMAERIAAPETRCVAMPDALPFDEGSALVATYGTALYALTRRGRLKSGETVLVLGAAGGVGLAAVQLARSLGARVFAAASSAEKVELARQNGAEEGLVYAPAVTSPEARKELTEAIRSLAGDRGVDVVVDTVGGGYAEAALRSMAWKGRYLVIGFPAGIPNPPFNLALLKGCDIVGVFWGGFANNEPEERASLVQEIIKLYEQGQIRPHISNHFSLEEAPSAIELLSSRQATGKIVINVQ